MTAWAERPRRQRPRVGVGDAVWESRPVPGERGGCRARGSGAARPGGWGASAEPPCSPRDRASPAPESGWPSRPGPRVAALGCGREGSFLEEVLKPPPGPTGPAVTQQQCRPVRKPGWSRGPGQQADQQPPGSSEQPPDGPRPSALSPGTPSAAQAAALPHGAGLCSEQGLV